MLKRIFDIIFAGLGLILSAPLFIFLAMLVWIKLGSPVLYSQIRPGRHGQLFKIYKFRTMLDLKNADGIPLPDKNRLTPFGKFLRATSLDEQPELWNILRGDMSLVGPRPLLVEYLPLYSREQQRRHEVRPGLTGWAQVNGRNAISWENRLNMDVWYVDNQSFFLDIKILFLTVIAVLKRKGITAEDDVTMPRFTGTQNQKTI